MDFFDNFSKSAGGYIFVSHSHNDIEKVRILRNRLESYGFEPLCFYLKCLNDDSEIEDLIKREIDAREWFLFVNSENARQSKWVRKERDYIEFTNHKKIVTVNLDDDEEIEKSINKLCHNLRVYIAYSAQEYNLAKRIHGRLRAKDYLPFMAPDDLPAGVNFEKVIANSVVKAAQEGCVLFLVSDRSLSSEWIKKEIELSFSQNGNVIPVFLENLNHPELPTWFQYYCSDRQWYSLSKTPSDDEIDTMIDRIGSIIVKNK